MLTTQKWHPESGNFQVGSFQLAKRAKLPFVYHSKGQGNFSPFLISLGDNCWKYLFSCIASPPFFIFTQQKAIYSLYPNSPSITL